MNAGAEQEAAIDRMVRLFYELGLADDVLGPIFRENIHDWEPHIKRVVDFWSGVVHGTDRYQGNAFAPHLKLKFEANAFDHWIAVFESAANDALAPEDAAKAIRIARHMAESFRAGLFPFKTADGKLSRVP